MFAPLSGVGACNTMVYVGIITIHFFCNEKLVYWPSMRTSADAHQRILLGTLAHLLMIYVQRVGFLRHLTFDDLPRKTQQNYCDVH